MFYWKGPWIHHYSGKQYLVNLQKEHKKGCELTHDGSLKMDDRTSWWAHKEGFQGLAGIRFRYWWTGSILTVGYCGRRILTEGTG